MSLAILKKINNTQLTWLLTMISGLIAWRVLAVERGNINDDATLYFEAAKLFTAGQWQQGFDLFPWPFYSLLIASMHQLTSLHLTHCAQLLSIVFYAITCFSLSKIVLLAGGDKVAIIAVNLLVWSNLYITGSVLGMLLRDVGFWAFLISGIAAFILSQQTQLYRFALLWQGLMLLAMLFRIEAIGYVVLLPLIIFWQKNTTLNSKLSHYLRVNIMLLVVVMGIFIAFSAGLLANLSSLGRLNEVNDLAFNGSQSFLAAFQVKSDLMAKQVLGRYLEDYASASLAISLLCVTIYKTILAGGLMPLVLIVTRGKQTFTLPNITTRQLLVWVAAIALLNALIITFRSYVLSTRYVIAFGFIVFIFAAFALSNLYASYKTQQLKYQFYGYILLVISLFMVVTSIKNIAPKPDAYYYEQNAVAWIKNHTQSTNARIYYDSSRLRFYAQAPWAGREDIEKFDSLLTALNAETVRYDYLLIRTKPSNMDKQNQLKRLQHYEAIKHFSNKSGNQIIIMQHTHLNDRP
jgi:hypothetical protein